MFIEYIRTMKQYRCLEHRTRRNYYTPDIIFHERSPYYERLLRPSLSSPDQENSSKSEWEQKHEYIIAAPRQPSATAARPSQKTRLKNLESNLGLS